MGNKPNFKIEKKIFEQILYQGKSTNGEQAHEKLRSINYQANAKCDTTELSEFYRAVAAMTNADQAAG